MKKIRINSAADTDKRDMPQAPLTRFKKYRKYGFVLTRHQYSYCPTCQAILNAGPNYMPERCSKCGQLIDWDGYTWTPDEFIKYMPEGDASEDDDVFAVD